MMQEYIQGNEQLAPRLSMVKPLPDYQLELTFQNGEKRLFDARPLLTIPAYKRLESKAVFNTVHISFGTLQWPFDIDYCPDCLYDRSKPV